MIYPIPFELDEIVLLKVTKTYNTSLYQIEYLDVNKQDIPEEGTILGKITLLGDNINAPRSYKYLHIQIISNSINISLNSKEIFVSSNKESAWYLPLENITKL